MNGDKTGIFYIVGTPIGNMGDISRRAIETITNCSVIMCEDTRESKKLLSLLNISFIDKKLVSVREQNEQSQCDYLISLLNDGLDVVYMSDAGMPAISDPGSRLVDAVHIANLKVNVIPGPSAVTSAIALSGFESPTFIFKGFFPRKESEQIKETQYLESVKDLVVYFESPNRLVATLKLLKDNLDEQQQIVVAREISKKFEETFRGSSSQAYEHFKAGVKGECVLVIDSSTKTSDLIIDKNVEEAIGRLQSLGVSSKDTIELVGLLSSVAKNDLKEIYNRLKG